VKKLLSGYLDGSMRHNRRLAGGRMCIVVIVCHLQKFLHGGWGCLCLQKFAHKRVCWMAYQLDKCAVLQDAASRHQNNGIPADDRFPNLMDEQK
jgi:hypothetical protein